MSENNINVGGRLHSIATGNVLAGSDEILDDALGKKQSQVNVETYALVESVNNALASLSPEQQGALDVSEKANNNEVKLGYYICQTESNVTAKAIAAANYILGSGGSIKIKMNNANTANNATLNINSTGAKALYYAGERASANNSWEAGETVEVYYDGTSFYANNVAGGSGSGDGAFDVSVKYPTSGVEGGNTYTLEGALAVLNSNLSASKKKGGMSIKFVQSSDNKYVQYRLMADSWSINTNDWSFCGDDMLVDNSEYIEVKTDSGDKILEGIKTDGTKEFNIPTTFKDDVTIKGSIINEGLSDELNSKVVKVDGKGLSTNDFTNEEKEVVDSTSYAKNPEWIRVETDNDNKILGGRKANGTMVENMPIETPFCTTEILDNPEWLNVMTDKKGFIVEGIDKNGNHRFACIPKQISEYINALMTNLFGTNTYDNQPTVNLDDPLRILLKGTSYIASIKEWGVIGASYESGVFEYKKLSDGTYGSTISREFYSWPQILGRINQTNFTNFTIPGVALKTWCQDQSEYGWGNGQVGASANPKQAYILIISSNDADVNKGPAIAGNIATDVDFANYNNNADTEAGWVCGAIQRIRSVAPHSFIFLSTIRNANSTVHTTIKRIQLFNEVIRQVPSYFNNVYLLDMYKYGLDFHDSRVVSKYMVNNHMSPAGYLLQAYQFNTYIDAIMREYARDFKYSAFVNTDLESAIDWNNY